MKKLTRLLTACLFAVILLVTGIFTSFAADLAVDDATVASIVESVVPEITGQSEEELNSSIELYESYEMPGIADGFRGYLAVKPSLGSYQSVGTASYVQNEDGTITITAPVTFENGTADFILQIDDTGYISTFQFVNGSSSKTSGLGAKMKEASINLVVGMGTVFLVLIFLCWIISLFKNVSVIEKKLAERKAAKTAVPAVKPAENREVLELVPETKADDDEIQAVIAAAIAAYEAETGCAIQKQPALSNGITIKTYRRN